MRGQAHTLEGVVAGIIVMTSLVFALQVTAVTPLSASTSSQQLENQQEAVATGALASAAEVNALKPAVLYGTSDASGRFYFHDTAGDRFFKKKPPTNRFGALLDRKLGDRGLAYNVYVVYGTTSGGTERRRMVYQGNPSDNAVAAQRMVTLYDDDVLYEPDGDAATDDAARPTSTELASAGDDFYARDVAGGPVFNVVEVEVVVWRQ